MKILIIKLGAIGDIIHTLPVLSAIRSTFPDAAVSWAAEQRSAEILRDNPLIDNLIEVDTRSMRGSRAVEKILTEGTKQIKNLRQNDFDIAIDFQGLLKSGMIAKLSGAKSRWGFARRDLREPAARVFYTDTAKIPPMTHVARRSLALAGAALGADFTDAPIEFPIFATQEHENEANEIAADVGQNFAILNPAGGWVTKLWNAGNYGKLADRLWSDLGMRSIVVSGPNESQLAASVAAASSSGNVMLVEPSLKGFFELAKRAKIYIGGDTGPTHIAIAAGTPVVGIYGPTEWWRNGSVNADDVCVERLDIDCRVDCHRRTCSKWICMEITPDAVFEAVRTRLSRIHATSEQAVVSKILR
ncbi:MAG: lipopolysaccharide heptosyltransferase I [Acidobacteria bacterium]|nr:MAG: lipopolysaccharide heptosyltransferase I [Acidobacteriota bacterium]